MIPVNIMTCTKSDSHADLFSECKSIFEFTLNSDKGGVNALNICVRGSRKYVNSFCFHFPAAFGRTTRATINSQSPTQQFYSSLTSSSSVSLPLFAPTITHIFIVICVTSTTIIAV